MKLHTPAPLVAALVVLTALVALASRSLAQWGSIPYAAANPIVQTDHLVAHTNAQGVQVFSAATAAWVTVSPPGSTIRAQHDWVLVTEETGNVLRAYSALLNQSAAITTASGGFPFVFAKGKTVFVVDNPSGGGTPAMRAYSAMLNTWSSVTPSASYQLAYTGDEFAVFYTLNQAWGYSAYHGSWTSYTHATGTLLQLKTGTQLATIELETPLPAFKREIAAYSPWTASWAVAPSELWSGGPQIWGGNVFACTKRVTPTDYRWMGFSTFTGAWTTSSLAHANLSNVSAKWGENVIIASDTDTSVRFEAFGARNPTWTAKTGANLDWAPTFSGNHHDYGLIQNTSNGDVHAFSGLRASGWTTLSPGIGATHDTTGAHLALVMLTVPRTYWVYSPMLGTWSAPLVVNSGSNYTLADGVIGVRAANVDATNSRFYGLSARSNTWVMGPLVPTSELYTDATSSTVLLYFAIQGTGKGKCRAFDERYGQWAPLYTTPASSPNATVGSNVALVWWFTFAPALYSTRRGDWISPSGPANVAQTPTFGADVVAYVDSANKLWAGSAIDEGHTWLDWPNSLDYQVPGAVGGVTPFLGYSVRGTPSIDLALVYAAPTASTGLALPGLGGLLYLDVGSAFSLGSLGVVDADGLREKKFPLPSAFTNPSQFWLQPVLVNSSTFAARFGGRAEQAWLL